MVSRLSNVFITEFVLATSHNGVLSDLNEAAFVVCLINVTNEHHTEFERTLAEFDDSVSQIANLFNISECFLIVNGCSLRSKCIFPVLSWGNWWSHWKMLMISVFKDNTCSNEWVQRNLLSWIGNPFIADFSNVDITEQGIADLNTQSLSVLLDYLSSNEISNANRKRVSVFVRAFRDFRWELNMFEISLFRWVDA